MVAPDIIEMQRYSARREQSAICRFRLIFAAFTTFYGVVRLARRDRATYSRFGGHPQAVSGRPDARR